MAIDPVRCEDFMSYRIRLGFTLRQMSERTGLSPATLHRLERRKIKATPRSRVRLQESLDLTQVALNHLLGNGRQKTRSQVARLESFTRSTCILDSFREGSGEA